MTFFGISKFLELKDTNEFKQLAKTDYVNHNNKVNLIKKNKVISQTKIILIFSFTIKVYVHLDACVQMKIC